jgi:hypothetical protein
MLEAVENAILNMIFMFQIPFKVIYIPTHIKGKGKVHPCTGTEALYRPYSP